MTGFIYQVTESDQATQFKIVVTIPFRKLKDIRYCPKIIDRVQYNVGERIKRRAKLI